MQLAPLWKKRPLLLQLTEYNYSKKKIKTPVPFVCVQEFFTSFFDWIPLPGSPAAT